MTELTADLSVNPERDVAEWSIDLVIQSEPFLQEFSVSRELRNCALIRVGAPETGLH